MVRRSHLTRLTLGRSAFEPPENIEQPRPDNDETPDDAGIYTQRYNERGYPVNDESRAISRRLRRAQNDVLATVGVCVGKDKDTIDSIRRRTKGNRERVQRVVSENELGLFTAATDLGLMFVLLWWTAALRGRLQTFRFYDSVSLRDILKIEPKHFGFFKFAFAGMPAWILAFASHLFRTYLLDEIVEFLFGRLMVRATNKRMRRLLRASKFWLYEVTSYTLFAFAIPLQLFSYLQMLDLIPATAVLSPWSLVPFSAASPIQIPLPTSATMKDLLSWVSSLALSPVVLLWVSLKWREIVEPKIYYFLRSRILLPDNPDYLSLEASREDDLDSGAIPGIGWTKESQKQSELSITNLAQTLSEWSQWIRDSFPLRWKTVPTFTNVSVPQHGGQPSTTGHHDLQHAPTNSIGMAPSRSSSATPSPSELFNLDDVFSDSSREVFSNAGPIRLTSPPPIAMLNMPMDDTHTSTAHPHPPIRRRASTINSNATFPTSRPTTPPDSPLPIHTVRVSAHHTDANDTVTMQLEVSAPVASPVDAVFANSEIPPTVAATPEDPTQLQPVAGTDTTRWPFQSPIAVPAVPPASNRPDSPSSVSSAASAEDVIQERPRPARQLHRVTALSNHPPDSLASHTATLISNTLFLPLESLLLRSIALAYLSPTATPNISELFGVGTAVGVTTATALGLRGAIRPVNVWFGGPGVRIDYACKMGLVLALQASLSAGMWLSGMGFVVWAGKKWFRWGAL